MTTLTIVAGHAIYQNKKWHGVPFTGDEPHLQFHIKKGCEQISDDAIVVFSGGHTRPHDANVLNGTVTNSEARGMLEYAKDNDLVRDEDQIHLEEFARDAFENMLFSLFVAYRACGHWPSKISVVSFAFKRERFSIVADALGFGSSFEFFGIGGPSNPKLHSGREQEYLDAARLDPLHRGPFFECIRTCRTNVSDDYLDVVCKAYATPDNPIGHIIEQLRTLTIHRFNILELRHG